MPQHKAEENREIYREKRIRVKKIIQDEKRNCWDRKCRYVETYIGGKRCTEAWNFISNITSDGNLSKLQMISAERWEEHYQRLLTKNRVELLEEEGTVVEMEG